MSSKGLKHHFPKQKQPHIVIPRLVRGTHFPSLPENWIARMKRAMTMAAYK